MQGRVHHETLGVDHGVWLALGGGQAQLTLQLVSVEHDKVGVLCAQSLADFVGIFQGGAVVVMAVQRTKQLRYHCIEKRLLDLIIRIEQIPVLVEALKAALGIFEYINK